MTTGSTGDQGIMPSSSSAGPATLAVIQQKPTVLRLKRRRDLDAPEHLILEVQTTTKKQKGLDALLAQFAAVNIESSAASRSLAAAKKRRKFLRISTLPSTALQTAEEVETFIREASTEGPRVPIKGPESQSKVLDKGREQRRSSALQASRTARYQQVRQRRAATGTAEGGSAGPSSNTDAWKQVFHVYEIEAVVDDASGKSSKGLTTDEERIMREYLPMVQEYLGKPVTEDSSTSGSSTTRDKSAPDSSQEDEWVYDVYVPVEGSWDDEREGDSGPTPTPVIEVSEDEDQLYWETQHDDEDYDSEDSNAENYYAASYPDEEDADDLDEDDDELHYMYPDMRHARRGHSDGEDSYGEVSSDDDLDRPAGRRYFA